MAAWIGRTSVPVNVAAQARRDGQPARHTEARSRGLMLRAPARMRTVASAGIATWPTKAGKPTTITPTHSPARMAAQRPRAPDDTFSAVVLSEPPTGTPRNSPAAMLAAPWAMKSRDARLREPSGLGTFWLTPAP